MWLSRWQTCQIAIANVTKSVIVSEKPHNAGAPEPEITPEMIEAGLDALWATGAIEHPCGADEDVVRRVFNAMILAASCAPRAQSAHCECRECGQ